MVHEASFCLEDLSGYKWQNSNLLERFLPEPLKRLFLIWIMENPKDSRIKVNKAVLCQRVSGMKAGVSLRQSVESHLSESSAPQRLRSGNTLWLPQPSRATHRGRQRDRDCPFHHGTLDQREVLFSHCGPLWNAIKINR